MSQLRAILPLILGGVFAVIVLLIGLALMKRYKYRDRSSETQTHSEQTPPTGAAVQNATETRGQNVTYAEDYCPVDKEDSIQMEAGNTRPYVAHGHDYTDDVSRYTQQPGPEVNDVSRFTHGVGIGDDDFEERLQQKTAASASSRPSVGSRVERRRSRRRKK